MALSEKHRSSIYTKLAPMIGEEEAQALVSQFPARDLDEPVTKEFVRSEGLVTRSELRSEMAELGSELRSEMAELGSELRSEMAELGSELRSEMAELGSELRSEMAELRSGLIMRFDDAIASQTRWTVGTIIGAAVAIIVANGLLG